MYYISVAEVAKKWEISGRRVQILCNGNRIPGAYKVGKMWVIPVNAVKPTDERIRSGKYCKE